MQSSTDVKGGDQNGMTPLHLAARDGNVDVVQGLILAGVEVNAKAADGTTPLHMAAEKGNVKVVELLLAHGADVKATAERWGGTPLHRAVERGHRLVTEALIAHGADVNARVEGGGSALHFCTTEEMAELLISRGADVHARCNTGETPLHCAAERSDEKLVEWFAAHGADVNTRPEMRCARVLVASSSGREQVVPRPHLCLRFRVCTERTIHSATDGDTPLFGAYESFKVVEALIRRGADVNARNNEEETVLMSLAHYPDFNLVRALLRAGARADSVGGNGRTAMHVNVAHGPEYCLVELLHAFGAPANATQHSGPPLVDATSLGQHEQDFRDRSRGEVPPLLHEGCLVELLLCGADPRARFGDTTLVHALHLRGYHRDAGALLAFWLDFQPRFLPSPDAAVHAIFVRARPFALEVLRRRAEGLSNSTFRAVIRAVHKRFSKRLGLATPGPLTFWSWTSWWASVDVGPDPFLALRVATELARSDREGYPKLGGEEEEEEEPQSQAATPSSCPTYRLLVRRHVHAMFVLRCTVAAHSAAMEKTIPALLAANASRGGASSRERDKAAVYAAAMCAAKVAELAGVVRSARLQLRQLKAEIERKTAAVEAARCFFLRLLS